MVSQANPPDVPTFVDHSGKNTVLYCILGPIADMGLHGTMGPLGKKIRVLDRFQRCDCVDVHHFLRRTTKDGRSKAYGGMAEDGASAGVGGGLEPSLDKELAYRSKMFADGISRLVWYCGDLGCLLHYL